MGFLGKKFVVVAALVAGVLLHAECSSGAELSAPEYKLKAGFIYNFAKLTEWPAGAFDSVDSPLKIGVLGTDPMARYLEQEAKGRLVTGRSIKVLRISNPAEASHCHVLFIPAASEGVSQEVLKRVRLRPVLTIGENRCFPEPGIMIRLYRSGETLRFEVVKDAAETAGLKLSSKLQALATVPGKDQR